MSYYFAIVDDHSSVRKGVAQILLEEFLGSKIVEAQSAEEFFKLTNKEGLHMLISDLSLQGRSGIELTKQFKVEFPQIPVIILSMHPEEQYAIRAFKAGASGYLTKDAASEELILAVKSVLAGKKYIPPNIAELLVTNMNAPSIGLSHEQLSDRELEVLKLLGAGLKVSEVAIKLKLSAQTISTYRTRILAKLGMKTNADLVKYAINNQLNN